MVSRFLFLGLYPLMMLGYKVAHDGSNIVPLGTKTFYGIFALLSENFIPVLDGVCGVCK